MLLYVDFESPTASALCVMRRLLTNVHHVLEHGAATGCEKLPDGGMRLRCQMPSNYKPRVNHNANYLQAQISRSGYLFEVAECHDDTCGGWLGSCIPLDVCRIFLDTWLTEHTSWMQQSLLWGASA